MKCVECGYSAPDIIRLCVFCKKSRDGRYSNIVDDYNSGLMTTKMIAEKYDTTTRSVQRIIKRAGGKPRSRTEAQLIAWKVSDELKQYREKVQSTAQKHKKRKGPQLKLRYQIISEHPYCELCGLRPPEVVLHIDHIDNNRNNDDPANFQVLCNLCNLGKRKKT